jgi:predicted RNA binding protein YcfA (HicA-like mRNA interferase family)
MIGRLPSLKAREVIRALERGGFVIVRSSGSHHRLVHKTDPTRQTTVPVHKGKDFRAALCAPSSIKQASRSMSSSPCFDALH